MILDARAIVLGYPFVAMRFHRVALCDPQAVEDCCARATALAAGSERDEPAAIFFAFAERRRAFPFAWTLMADIVTTRQAVVNGLRLAATHDELGALCVEVLHHRMDYPAVRAWFLAHFEANSTP